MAMTKMNHTSTYDSVAEFVEAALAAPTCEANARHFTSEKSAGFICADRRDLRTYPAALEALNAPSFEPGVSRVEKLAREITVPTPHSIKRKLSRGDHGDTLDMRRVWAGDLANAWTRAKRQNTAGASTVNIGIHGSDNGSVSAEAIAWRGVAALALADALEASGYTVAIRTMVRAQYSYNSGAGRYAVDISIKGAGEPLDLHKAANLVASTALFRGACFRHIIVTAQAAISSGLGSNDFKGPEPVAGYDYNVEVTAAVRDAATAQHWINEHVAALDATHHANTH